MRRRPRHTHVAFLGGPELAYEELRPPPELAPWIAVSWRVRARADAELRIVPDGCMDLIRGDVVGTFTGPEVVRFAAGDVAEGIRFHPGGFAALFGVPASELVGLRVPIVDVLPRFASLRRLAADAERPDPLAAAAGRPATCASSPATAATRSASCGAGSPSRPATAPSA